MACEDHVYAEQNRTFTKPILVKEDVVKGFRFQGDAKETSKALYGFTTIEIACPNCGEMKLVVGIGDLT